ncbi:MAG TPA: relaxase/mobilization nuclease domain-containing protein, partial [Acidisoma sp.]|nr:relaxase/mobilization nuclease domain-containing protein [Acidisoma sp.]
MVIKGGARGDGAGLAAHLLRMDTNERAEVLELRGVAAADLDGGLREMEAVASGTRCKRPLYHASINTDPGEHLTDEQRAMAIDRLEAKLGLTGQPRAVVEHVKEGREHVHVVWSRIDLDHMRAIPDSHNYRKHEEAARELEREFG